MSSNIIVCNKPHAVCIPLPLQRHIKAMLKLAKLLHYRGFHVTFVNTEFNHRRFLKSLGPNFVDDFPNFRFQTIPDSEADATTQNIPLLCDSMRKNFLPPFRNLLLKLNEMASSNNSVGPPVTSIVSDGFRPFAITVAEELRLPIAMFFTLAAVGFIGCKQYPTLVEKGLAPLKGTHNSCKNNIRDHHWKIKLFNCNTNMRITLLIIQCDVDNGVDTRGRDKEGEGSGVVHACEYSVAEVLRNEMRIGD
ncbi:unnamed protein product [Malus baccata var. baccata]